MSAQISQVELRLLQYLHAHSCGSGERIWLDPKPITRGLGISIGQLAEDSAALAGHGLAGVRAFRAATEDAVGVGVSAIWITKKGEDYLRGHHPHPLSVVP
jgi:hypothetical protein